MSLRTPYVPHHGFGAIDFLDFQYYSHWNEVLLGPQEWQYFDDFGDFHKLRARAHMCTRIMRAVVQRYDVRQAHISTRLRIIDAQETSLREAEKMGEVSACASEPVVGGAW